MTSNNTPKMYNNKKVGMLLSIALTIVTFLIICTLIFASYILLINGAGTVEKKLSLCFAIVSCLMLIPFGILVTISYLEIKTYKQTKNSLTSKPTSSTTQPEVLPPASPKIPKPKQNITDEEVL